MHRMQDPAWRAAAAPQHSNETARSSRRFALALRRMPNGSSADALVQRLRDTLAARADEPGEVLVHERALPAQAASLGILRPHLPAPLARALLAQGITQLYAHQVQTVEALREGKN